MEDEFVGQIYIDTSLESYRSFFENEWAQHIATIADNSHKLLQIVSDLIIDWRGASYTTALPLQILEHVKSFHDGFVKSPEPNTDLLLLSEAITKRIIREIDEFRFDSSLAKRLQTKIVEIGADVMEKSQNAPLTFPMEQAWQDYLRYFSYQLSIWSSQRICYVAIYNAYENFITQCMRVAMQQSRYRIGRNFRRDFSSIFGQRLLETCWTDRNINVARLARHALSHASGQVTRDLSSQNHDFIIVNNKIQVTPDKIRGLYNLLKEAAATLAQKASSMPEFQ